MKYPTINRQPMDSLRRKAFDRLRREFRELIVEAANRNREAISDKTLTTAAWNCAFIAVTHE